MHPLKLGSRKTHKYTHLLVSLRDCYNLKQFICFYAEPVLRSKDYMSSLEYKKIGCVLCLYTTVSLGMPEMESIKLVSFLEDVPLVEFMYLYYWHAGWGSESYCRWLRSLLFLCDVFQAQYNSLVCWFCTGTPGLVLFQNVTLTVNSEANMCV